MPLHITAAASSRVTKQRPPKKPVFSNAPRRKSASQSCRKPAPKDDAACYGRADLVRSLPDYVGHGSVIDMMRRSQESMFMPIPERGAGMNSVRTVEVLTFRGSLPPMVTMARLHALGQSPTEVDREVAGLVRDRIIRKISIPGAVSECVVLVEDWINSVKRAADITEEVKEKYISLLAGSSHPVVSSTSLTASEAKALTLAGFLTATSSRSSASAILLPGASVMSTLTSLATVSASGTVHAVGGPSILDHAAGGDRRSSANSAVPTIMERSALLYSFSLPSTGSYLKLLASARSHLVSLITKLSPTHRVVSQQNLRERWDGGVAGVDQIAENKRARGEFVGVLPGRTKKWKGFYGMNYDWVLAECAGSGIVEGVRTGDGGIGVRAV